MATRKKKYAYANAKAQFLKKVTLTADGWKASFTKDPTLAIVITHDVGTIEEATRLISQLAGQEITCIRL